MNVHQIITSSIHQTASSERLTYWFDFQRNIDDKIHYILPSQKWLQTARNRQPGITFQTFDDLATHLLVKNNVNYQSITDDERVLLFQQLILQNHDSILLSDNERRLKAKAFSDTYGQLKRLGLTINDLPTTLLPLKDLFTHYEELYINKHHLFDSETQIFQSIIHASTLPSTHVVIDGFVDFSPLQYVFIKFLIEKQIPMTIYMPDLDTNLTQQTIHTLENLGFILQSGMEKDKSIQKVLSKSLIAAMSIEEEIHGVLDQVTLEKGEGRYDQYGIILCNEANYLEELVRISKLKNIPVKKPKKLSVDQTNFYQFLRTLLTREGAQASKWDQVPLLDQLSGLYFISNEEFSEIKFKFLKDGEIEASNVSKLFSELKSFEEVLYSHRKIGEYLVELQTFLATLPLKSYYQELLKDRTLIQNHYQAAIEFRTILLIEEMIESQKTEIEGKGLLDLELSVLGFSEWLLKLIGKKELFIERGPSDGITILPLQDASLFSGKSLFVLGVNEGIIPRKISLGGYFQEEYLKEYELPFPLPTSSYFMKKDETLLKQLDYVSEKVSFSYVKGMNHHQPDLPSIFMLDSTINHVNWDYSYMNRMAKDSFESEKEYEEKLVYHLGAGFQVDLPGHLMHLKVNVETLKKGEEALSDKWKDALKQFELAITKLERYAECSFKYAMEHVLKIPEPLKEQNRLDHRLLGTMIHKIIERFYKDVRHIEFERVQHFFEGDEDRILQEIFEEEWLSIQQSHPEVPQKQLNREKEDWNYKLRKWLAAEKIRFWANPELKSMRIFRLEESVELNFPLATGDVLTLRGKIDRLDIDEHGFVIYDYKTSPKRLDFTTEVPKGLTLQIPLYMIAVEKEFAHGRYKDSSSVKPLQPIGGGYISMKEPHVRKKNTVWKDKDQKVRFEPRFQTHIESIDAVTLKQNYKLDEIVEQLWEGVHSDFSVRPASQTACKYCLYKVTCRISTELLDEAGETHEF
ncbi:PD-(D/E)XK nuclease family protein [Litchfieldia alkalitelluris]|uniref:PD-(D/E)XK nuclease family protein n=1 Tax=Litchfieldia alkalitelluris TaxID=304268 RepID=UPI000997C881|nr:PD-(D/E)XK nuclease family protein [Litchfieldia alkalitelluris]